MLKTTKAWAWINKREEIIHMQWGKSIIEPIIFKNYPVLIIDLARVEKILKDLKEKMYTMNATYALGISDAIKIIREELKGE